MSRFKDIFSGPEKSLEEIHAPQSWTKATEKVERVKEAAITIIEKGKEIKQMGYWDTHPVIEDSKLTTPPFIPEFRPASIVGVDNSGGTVIWPLNSDYFASQPTAQWIANKFGDGVVYSAPFFESGPFKATAETYLTKLKDGRKVNAGILAAYYVRNPEDKFPGLAEKLIKSQLGI